MTDEKEANENAGPSTDQHVSWGGETEPFPTDREPDASTPAAGSSNAGVNETKANRQDQNG